MKRPALGLTLFALVFCASAGAHKPFRLEQILSSPFRRLKAAGK